MVDRAAAATAVAVLALAEDVGYEPLAMDRIYQIESNRIETYINTILLMHVCIWREIVANIYDVYIYTYSSNSIAHTHIFSLSLFLLTVRLVKFPSARSSRASALLL